MSSRTLPAALVNNIHALSPLRLGAGADAAGDEEGRSPYEIDSDRIVFSEGFHKLHDKTQVHGGSAHDCVRSRLTHSIEVSRVGRALGMRVAPQVLPALGLADRATPADLAHTLLAACLIHDIGNPPFGHTGEDVVSDYFRANPALLEGTGARFQTEMTHFEGNAQGFRVVSRLEGWHEVGGLMLTSATLAAFAKYPFSADPSVGTEKKKHKYGFYESEAAFFANVAANTGMHKANRDVAWRRHILAYLVEVADDTCYQVVDLEDAVKLGVIRFEEAEQLLMPLVNVKLAEYRGLDSNKRKLEYLRGKAIGALSDHATAAVAANLDALIDGTHSGDLLRETPLGGQLEAIERFSRTYIYRNPARLEQDRKAGVVLTTLLDATTGAMLEREKAGGPIRHPVLDLFPVLQQAPLAREGWLRHVGDLISGMTDSGATAAAAQIAAL